MNTSNEIKELVTALVAAQAKIKNAVFNRTNPAFKSKYADLASVREAVTVPLAENGLVIVHTTELGESHILVKTRLLHTSGQWIECAYPIIADTNKPQQIGSAYTYAKRYSISALCNIASEEDDDANAAQDAKANGNGFPAGNPDVKYYKSDTKTPGAVKAQENNTYYKTLEREILNLRTKAEGRQWRSMRELDIQERVGPEAMIHLSDFYETHMAALP